ncbi:MAG: indole-3-glycerol phosphate synthase TrpC [Candidatus Margulisiibacteriota bacterium]
MLKTIITQKQHEIHALYTQFGLTTFQHEAEALGTTQGTFFSALAQKSDRLKLISEVKKASPSKGVIRADFDPIQLAKSFQASGASALSVLTDETFFQGHLSYIKRIKEQVQLPVLRKDFILDPIQVYESKVAGADAILLIMACLSLEDANQLLALAKTLGLSVLVEVHSEAELDQVLTLPVNMIGINNRNLGTFDVDLNTAIRLTERLKKSGFSGVVVAESGYQNLGELETVHQAGCTAVLIGEGLAKNHEGLFDYFRRQV